MSAIRRSRQLYATPTQSSANKASAAALTREDVALLDTSVHRQSVSPPPHASRTVVMRSVSAASTSAPTIVAKSVHSSPSRASGGRGSAGSTLRRDQLSAVALGLGDPIGLRRASPSAGARPRVGSSQRPLWSVSPRPASSAPRPTSRVGEPPSPATGPLVPPSSSSIAIQDPVRVVITSHGAEATSFIRDPVEQCVVLSDASNNTNAGQYYCDASYMTNSERPDLGPKVADHIARHVTFQGNHSVVFALGAAGSGKTESLFGVGGTAQSYVALLMEELNRTFLSNLWTVQLAVLNVVDGQAFDALPRSFQSRRHAVHDPQDPLMAMLMGDGDVVLNQKSSANVLQALRGINSSQSDAGTTAAHMRPTASLMEPRELFHKLSVTLRDAEDVEHFFESIAQRARSRHNVTWQEVVHVCVVPTLGVQQTFGGLMRSVGSVCFVELGAGMATDDELKLNMRAANAQRHTVTTVLNVLNAQTRTAVQRLANNNGSIPSSATTGHHNYSVHVPYGDCTLTTLLEPFLQDAAVTLIAHVHEDPAERTSSLSTLHAVDQLLRYRYPNGKAPVDYKALARTYCLKAESAERELEGAKKLWANERLQLESDRWMLRKAYDDLLQQCDDVGAAAALAKETSPTTSAAGGAFPSADALSSSEERYRELNNAHSVLKGLHSQVQREKVVLEEHITAVTEDLNVLRDAHQRLHHDRDVLLERYREHEQRKSGELGSKPSYDSFAESPLVESGKLLSDILGFLASADVIAFPGGGPAQHTQSQTSIKSANSSMPVHGSSSLLIIKASVALLQLTHQLAEREKLCNVLSDTANTTFKDPATSPPNRKASLYKSPITSATNDTSTTSFGAAQHLLKWQTWRALLDRLHKVGKSVVDHGNLCTAAYGLSSHDGSSSSASEYSVVHVNGIAPKGRNSSGLTLFQFASASSPSVFLDFWTAEHSHTSAPVSSNLPQTSSNAARATNTSTGTDPIPRPVVHPAAAPVPHGGHFSASSSPSSLTGLPPSVAQQLMSRPPVRVSTASRLNSQRDFAPVAAVATTVTSAALRDLSHFTHPQMHHHLQQQVVSDSDSAMDSPRGATGRAGTGARQPTGGFANFVAFGGDGSSTSPGDSSPTGFSFGEDTHETSALERLLRQQTSSLDDMTAPRHRPDHNPVHNLSGKMSNSSSLPLRAAKPLVLDPFAHFFGRGDSAPALIVTEPSISSARSPPPTPGIGPGLLDLGELASYEQSDDDAM